jgi:hypothetical protein
MKDLQCTQYHVISTGIHGIVAGVPEKNPSNLAPYLEQEKVFAGFAAKYRVSNQALRSRQTQ